MHLGTKEKVLIDGKLVGEPADKEEYKNEQQNDPETQTGSESEAEAAQKTSGCLLKVIAVLVLIVFTVFSLPDFPYLLTNPLKFMAQNHELTEDEIVSRCRPAVVSIESTIKNESAAAEIHLGTGFNLLPTGLIVTNQHVIEDSSHIRIRFYDGREYTVGHYETIPDMDIALIRLEAADLPVIELNRDEMIRSGDTVTIIGNPLGFEWIAQRGQVGQYYQSSENQSPIFDIGISINPGNSGSPVINSQSQVVGILFASGAIENHGQSESRALAIPAQALPAEYFE